MTIVSYSLDLKTFLPSRVGRLSLKINENTNRLYLYVTKNIHLRYSREK